MVFYIRNLAAKGLICKVFLNGGIATVEGILLLETTHNQAIFQGCLYCIKLCMH